MSFRAVGGQQVAVKHLSSGPGSEHQYNEHSWVSKRGSMITGWARYSFFDTLDCLGFSWLHTQEPIVLISLLLGDCIDWR